MQSCYFLGRQCYSELKTKVFKVYPGAVTQILHEDTRRKWGLTSCVFVA